MIAKNADRRVRKTKQVLRQGLVKLMTQKSVQTITVKELCETCDINRGTFYAHYNDVFDLLNKIEDEMLEQMKAMLEQYELLNIGQSYKNISVLCYIFEFLQQNADMCRVLLCNNGDIAFVEQVKDLVKRRFMHEWYIQFPQGDSAPSEFAFTFIVSGCIGVLQSWLLHDMPQSAEQLAHMVDIIIMKGAASMVTNQQN